MSKFVWGMALAAAFGALVAGKAEAADLSTPVYKAPVVEEAQSPWMIRLRALYVKPENGGSVHAIPFSDLNYTDSVIPELDISYFFTKNIAAELILGTTRSTISGGGALNGLGLGDVARVWILPPTLTLQYHFTDFGPFKPYIGAGVNYTVFYNQDVRGVVANSLFRSINVKDTWGLALQAGFDWMFDKHWGVNFDVKKIFLDPEFSLQDQTGAILTGTANLDPWLIGGGITYRF